MGNENQITVQDYTIEKLTREIAALKVQNAELEFTALANKQIAEKLQQENEELKKKVEESETEVVDDGK